MFLIEAANDTAVYVVEARGKRHVTPDEYAVFTAAGLKKVNVTAKQRDAFPNL